MAASAAATAIAASAATTAATAAVFPRLGLVNGQCAAADLLPVKGSDSRLRFAVIAHLHEAESLGPARVSIHDDLGRLDGAVRRKHAFQTGVGNLIRKIADIQLLAHLGPPAEENMR